MGVLFLLLAVSMAVATFVENDFGSAMASGLIYKSKWFEFIFLLLAINLAGRIIKDKLYRKEKLTVFLFHSAFLVMITGAFITRYFGYEGMIHIREGESSNICATISPGMQEGLSAADIQNVQTITLPFSIKLVDFVIDRYPGSDSPSGYRSEVVLIDEKNNIEKPFSVFMNNILKYKGYRFYQSSFDEDEAGTILSVNYDFAGILVTYTGYGLLFLFIILSMINKNSLFNTINARQWKSPLRKTGLLILLLITFSGSGFVAAQKLEIDKKTSNDFGKILVQDQKGRTEPLYTLSSDIVRKVTGRNEIGGYTPVQVVLGLYLDFDNWKDYKLIKVSNNDLKNRLGISTDWASFSDIVGMNDTIGYKLADLVKSAYSKAPAERSKLDKDVMKVDERINICFMVNQGDLMKIFPLKDGAGTWGTPQEALKTASGKVDSLYLENILQMFVGSIIEKNTTSASEIINSIKTYQQTYSEYELPKAEKINLEIVYYKIRIFEKLFPFYATVGLVLLIVLIFNLITDKKENPTIVRILTLLLFSGFLAHTIALVLRWYIAGHSPMSNGYESMIFISWVTILAGFIFRKRSLFALSATAVLASLTLLVAHMSFMDPEITNLVPVLKSYWLTLHVSVITGSYGFLGLGALLGLINIILLSVSNNENRERISQTIDELTVINYKTLTLGLYFLTIGTFLGAVWANESWGRYWGWDPKETWSLITIIIYSLVIHSRTIPGMKSIFTFNVISLFAFSTVLMTYFGVNYYLSGLHSYATGDSIEVPVFVYITIIALIIISLIGFRKNRLWMKM